MVWGSKSYTFIEDIDRCREYKLFKFQAEIINSTESENNKTNLCYYNAMICFMIWFRDRVQTVSVILSRIGLLKIYPPPPLLLSRQIWKMFRNHPTIWNPSIFTDMRCWHVCTYMYLADQIFWSSLERGPFKGTGGGLTSKICFSLF